MQDFELDFVNDASCPLDDFVSCTATGITNIVSPTISGIGGVGWSSVHNIELEPATVQAVPLPALFLLLGAGLAGLGMARRQRRD